MHSWQCQLKQFTGIFQLLLTFCYSLASLPVLCEPFLDKYQPHQVGGKTHQYFTFQSLLQGITNGEGGQSCSEKAMWKSPHTVWKIGSNNYSFPYFGHILRESFFWIYSSVLMQTPSHGMVSLWQWAREMTCITFRSGHQVTQQVLLQLWPSSPFPHWLTHYITHQAAKSTLLTKAAFHLRSK